MDRGGGGRLFSSSYFFPVAFLSVSKLARTPTPTPYPPPEPEAEETSGADRGAATPRPAPARSWKMSTRISVREKRFRRPSWRGLIVHRAGWSAMRARSVRLRAAVGEGGQRQVKPRERESRRALPG